MQEECTFVFLPICNSICFFEALMSFSVAVLNYGWTFTPFCFPPNTVPAIVVGRPKLKCFEDEKR